MNHSINEWQDMSLKKEVEQISKELRNRKSFDKPLLLEIYIGIITLILDKMLDRNDCPIFRNILMWSLFATATAILLYSLCVVWKNYREQINKIKREAVQIKPYVDMFDNNICYYALTASSFYSEYVEISALEGTPEDKCYKEKKVFYYIECNYYINKCIARLDRIQGVAQDVFTNSPEGVIKQSKIHITRLRNIVDLLSTIRTNLYNDFNPSVMADATIMLETTKISHEYDIIMNSTLGRISDNMGNEVQLKWIKDSGKAMNQE